MTSRRDATGGLRGGHVSWDRWSPLLLHASIVAPVLLAARVGVPAEGLLLLGGALVLVAYPFIVLMEFRLAPLILSPLSYFFAWHWLVLGVASLWKGLAVANGQKATAFGFDLVLADDLATGYAIYLLGIFVFHAGVTVVRPLPTRLPPTDEASFRWSAFGLLWFAGLVFWLFGRGLTWLGGLQGVATDASRAALCALALHEGFARRSPLRFWLVMAAGVGLEFILGSVSNSKGAAMLSLLPLFWMALRSRHRIRNLFATSLAAAVLYGGVVYPVNSYLRSESYLDASRGTYSVDAVVGARGAGGDSSVSSSLDAFVERIFTPTPLGFIVAQVNRYGFRDGETMEYLAYAMVPRLLWPDKPIVSRGRWFDLYVSQRSSGDETVNSLGQTNSGELYWNFGMPGVVVGMCSIGLLLGWLWRMAGATPQDDPLKMLLYVSIIISATGMMEAEFGSAFVGLVLRLLLFGVLFRLTTAKARISPLATT